ncbi:MAG: tRNA-dihydrouridine synthase [Nitrospira sp.]|nr:tRNA-dihydrouridine synthase [Nitrospira sp.]
MVTNHASRDTLHETAAGFWQTLPQPIIGLSPMDGVTDAAFRLTVARQGPPDITFTEFTSVGDVCRGPEHLLSTFTYSEEERPVVAQLYGKHPDLFYLAAHVVCELGFDGLDINMGCPSKNVASSGSGAALIKTPDLAHAIMRAARQGILDWANGHTLTQAGLKASRADLIRAMNVKRHGQPSPPRRVIPLSVKTRLGYDSVVVENWIGHLLEEQPAVISVHGRTLQQMYRGEADWQAIERAATIVRGTPTLLLGNGDVQSMDDVVRRVRESKVHGVLVGRGALGSPWFFRKKELARQAARDGAPIIAGSLDETLSLADRFRVMVEHARLFEGIDRAARFPHIRKHLGWYCKGFPHAAAMRARMVRASSSADVERIVAEHLASDPLAGAASAAMSSPALPTSLSCA